jgi:glycosyltransferase involved in cell wall biosynthesis
MPLVSVIIPSYNHGKFIAECIQSVFDQSFQDFEIVITDDGSTDQTIKIIEEINDPRISLYKFKVNQGASVAANNCISKSSGKYIAMLSSDDAWHPEKLAVQVDFLNTHTDIAAVFGKVDWIDEFNNITVNSNFPYKNTFDFKNRSRFEWLNHFFNKGNCLCHPCSMVRRDCYADVGFLNPAFASLPDFDLWVRICLKYDIYVLDLPLIKFRRLSNESNASGDKTENHFRSRFENKQILDNYLKLKDEKEILLVFPEAEKYGPIRKELLPFFLGRMAIDSGIDYKILWGLEKIYNLLLQESTSEILKVAYNFSFRDFLNYSKILDPFNISYVLPYLKCSPFQSQQKRVGLINILTKRYIMEVSSTIFKIFNGQK